MFDKIFNVLFVKTEKKKGLTVMSAKREIKASEEGVNFRGLKSERSESFWNNRGQTYGALFTSLNGRMF